MDRIARALAIVKENGGWKRSLFKLYRFDELKTGTLVGTDDHGNKYFENNYYFMGRNRWVEYADKVHMDYDGSQIPAEWHRWMHYMTDKPPTVEKPVQYKWLSGHRENMTGTSRAYMPYDTVPQKIHSWKPGQKSST